MEQEIVSREEALSNSTWEVDRKMLLECQRVEGLNIDRVRSYLGSLGVEMPPLYVLGQDDLDSINFATPDLRHYFDNKAGLYMPKLGIPGIIRGPELEQWNSSLISEAYLVEEIMHAIPPQNAIMTKDSTDKLQAQFIGVYDPVNGMNLLLEEAIANYFGMDYKKQYVNSQSLPQLLSNNGLFDLHGHRIPAHFFHISTDVQLGPALILGPKELSAYALDLLAQRYTDFRMLYLATRKNYSGGTTVDSPYERN